MTSKRRLQAALGLLLMGAIIVSGCTKKDGGEETPPTAPTTVSGARSALFALEYLQAEGMLGGGSRPAALLGVYVAEFLSRGSSVVVSSALKGIDAQTALAAEEDVPGQNDEDFALLQAFADALSVNVPELLNRSTDREESLSKYIEALRNVGTRAKTRMEELDIAIDNLRERDRTEQKEISGLEKQQREALRDKDFSTAGSVQEQLNEKQTANSETQLQLDQTRSIQKTFDELLEVYGSRLLALESNRQALIVGVTVVVVPGAEDFEILKNPSRREQKQGIESLMNGENLTDFLKIDSDLKK